MGGTRHLGEDYGMEPESKRHSMSNPLNRGTGSIIKKVEKDEKLVKNDKKKVNNIVN